MKHEYPRNQALAAIDSGVEDVPPPGIASLDRLASDNDPLTRAVQALVSLRGRAVSADVLTGGLPLVNGRLTPELALRALGRVGFSAKLVRRELSDLPPLLLPVILLMEDDDCCILLRQDPRGCQIYDPLTGTTAHIPASELAEGYTGYAILARQFTTVDENLDTLSSEAGDHWFWGSIQKLWKTYVLVAFTAGLISVIALASPLFVMNVYDRVLPNKAIPTMWVLVIGMGIALLFDLILRTLRAWLIDSTGRRADVLLASRIFSHVLSIQMSSKPPTTGSFASHLRDFESVREFFTSNTIATLTDMLFFILFLVVIQQIGGPIAYVPAVAALIIIGLGLLFQIPLRRAAERNAAEAAQRHSLLVETIAALETIKVVRAESHLQGLWEKLVGSTSRTVERVRQLTSTLTHISSAIQQMVSVAVIIVGVYLFQEGNISMGAIIASVMLASRCVAPLGQFAIVLARSQQSFSSLRALDKIMQMPSERPPGKSFLAQPITNCTIQFQNVVFAYPNSGVPAINDFTLTIRPGEKVGIIGKIGSGKTTIGRLLVKLYEPQKGSILIDGIDMGQYHPHQVRRAIGLLGQDAELFHGSIRSNITMGKAGAADSELVAAARLAGVEEFVRRYPAGYDTNVGERGSALSGGQRQAVALARVLIGDPQVIYLDEPSSAMDLASERQLIDQLRKALRPDQTVIVSTHRYSMLELIDRLVVIANGKVAADGPKEDVLEALRQQSAQGRSVIAHTRRTGEAAVRIGPNKKDQDRRG